MEQTDKDQVAYEAVLEDMQVLQQRHDFVRNSWRNKKTGDRYCVVGLALREEDMAVVVIYKKVLINLKAYSPDNEPCPMWTRLVNNFLEKFEPIAPVKRDTFTPGYKLTGEQQDV